MFAVGLTGGIGSGKSRVAECWLRNFSVSRIDADAICRELLQPGNEGWHALRQRIASSFFLPDGQLDRSQLRRELFAHPSLRCQVENEIHPLARREICRRMASNDSPLVLVEVPLLFEAGWECMFQRVVLVYAEPHVRLQRIVLRDRISAADATRALEAQSPLEELILRADHVLDNGGSWVWTRLQVLHLGRLLERSMQGEEKKNEYK